MHICTTVKLVRIPIFEFGCQLDGFYYIIDYVLTMYRQHIGVLRLKCFVLDDFDHYRTNIYIVVHTMSKHIYSSYVELVRYKSRARDVFKSIAIGIYLFFSPISILLEANRRTASYIHYTQFSKTFLSNMSTSIYFLIIISLYNLSTPVTFPPQFRYAIISVNRMITHILYYIGY